MKVERVSYDVMTPSAARGILEAIHWKPAIRWFVEAIHVLKPIRVQSIRRNEVGHKAPVASIRKAINSGDIGDLVLLVGEDRQQRAATVLVDVAYIIEARFDDVLGREKEVKEVGALLRGVAFQAVARVERRRGLRSSGLRRARLRQPACVSLPNDRGRTA